MMRLVVGKCLRIDPVALTDRYLGRRLMNIFTRYKMPFRKFWVHSAVLENSVFNWDEMDVARHLML